MDNIKLKFSTDLLTYKIVVTIILSVKDMLIYLYLV